MRIPFPAALLFACIPLVAGCAGSESPPFSWPPKAGETYPDVELRDTSGELVKLSSFQGKVLLIEPIGMT